MIPRPYQQDFVSKLHNALNTKGNTIGVAPTGSGKTIMMGMLLDRLGGQQLVLQHREELVNQNQQKFHKICPNRTSSIYGMGTKDPSGDTILGMVQTLGRKGEADNLPSLDTLIIDEAHHAIADTYQRVIDKAKEKNPNCKIAGVTATPARGDKKGLRPIFDNCAEHITLRKLISQGYLVPFRTFIATLPGLAEELIKVRKTKSGEYDMDEVETLMDTEANNEAIFNEWERVAGDRKTIFYCSTKNHAEHVCAYFQAQGVQAAAVFGDTPKTRRAELLTEFDRGDLQVIFNVAVLTEGYDSQPVSCIGLLRPCSFKSTMVQMIGRGLRAVDPEEYPGVIKKDCMVLDFGESVKIHGDFELSVQYDDEDGEVPLMECPECQAEVPISVEECPICGYFFGKGGGEGGGDEEKEQDEVVLTEVDVFNDSPFKWEDIFGTNKVLMATGFDAFTTCCAPDGENWIALGKKKGDMMKKLAVADKPQAIAAADDYLRVNESNNASKKSKRWMRDPPSPKQIEWLEHLGYPAQHDYNLNKYKASCLMEFYFNQKGIENKLFRR